MNNTAERLILCCEKGYMEDEMKERDREDEMKEREREGDRLKRQSERRCIV